MKTKLFLICLFVMNLTQGNTQNNTSPDYLGMIDKILYMEYAEIKMEVLRNDKLLNYYVMDYYRKGEKIRMDFLEPAAEKGRRMLNEETNLWMYMPRTGKVMKLPLKQAFMGSDASNRDLMRMAFRKDYEITEIEEADSKTVKLVLKAKDLSVSYHKMIIYFDTAMNAPVRQEMYSLSDKLIKTMDYAYEKYPDGHYYPSFNSIRDELMKSSVTKMYYGKVKRSNNKPAVYFTLGSIKQ